MYKSNTIWVLSVNIEVVGKVQQKPWSGQNNGCVSQWGIIPDTAQEFSMETNWIMARDNPS